MSQKYTPSESAKGKRGGEEYYFKFRSERRVSIFILPQFSFARPHYVDRIISAVIEGPNSKITNEF